MKKLEKLTLKEMCREFATIGFDEAQRLNGGYTVSEMDAMMAAETWTGGYVDDLGYVGDECCGFSSGSASCQTYVEWSNSQVVRFWDSTAKAAVGQVPIGGGVASMLSDLSSNDAWAANSAMLRAKVSGDDDIYIVKTDDGETITNSYYDENGKLIYNGN